MLKSYLRWSRRFRIPGLPLILGMLCTASLLQVLLPTGADDPPAAAADTTGLPFLQPYASATGSTTSATDVYLPLVFGSDALQREFEARVITHANLYRRQHGCADVTAHPILMGVARRHAEDMAQNDFFAHAGSDGSQFWERIAAAGYTYIAVAENIGSGYTTPEQMVDAWYNEQPPIVGHRDNLLNCAYRDSGVGYMYLENDTGNVTRQHYWVQIFAR